MRRARFGLDVGAILLGLLMSLTADGADSTPASRDELAQRVRPVLARCVKCHSGDTPAGDLDLSTREGAEREGESGEVALRPGEPEASRLYQLVSKRKMPPKKPLTNEQVSLVREWIQAGAPWTGTIRKEEAPPNETEVAERWALRPLTQPTPPQVRNASWVATPIDAFILARLESAGLTPAPAAERAVFIRRATFDMLGLAPSPEEIEAFEKDISPRAYEDLVDRLLGSPHYGERWGRHWLDLARFAESDGFEYDRIRDHAWRFRDYVIKSLNDDKPYSRFFQEQLAGDVLEPVTIEGISGTGFLVAGPLDEAGKLQQSVVMRSRAREEELEDIVAAVGQTFLGLTVNCARCHDHKFDPIPQRDYYRLKAAIEGVEHGNRSMATPAELKSLEASRSELTKQVVSVEKDIASIERAAYDSVLKGNAQGVGPLPMARWTFELDATDDIRSIRGMLQGKASVRDGRLVLDGKGSHLISEPLSVEIREKTLEAWVYVTNLAQRGGAPISIERMDGSEFDALVFGEREPAKWFAGSENFRRSRDLAAPTETATPGQVVHIAAVYDADGRITLYRDGASYGESYVPSGSDGMLRSYQAGGAHVLFGLRHKGAGNGFFTGEIEEARLYDRALSADEVARSFRAGVARLTPEQLRANLSEAERKRLDALQAELKQHRAAVAAIPVPPLTYAATPHAPPATFVLGRGDVLKQGEQVSAGGLSAVASPSPELGVTADAPEGDRRLALARWIADPQNPLTARVLVNRIWHYHFGTGIVATPNDFGANGDRPTHPELLDWLANDLIASGGRLKALHRRILLSNVYRQSSRLDAKAAAKDADNRLLWRFSPRRLEAESIRDAMLEASGNLNSQMGGPGFRPFTVTVFNSNLYTLTDPVSPEFDRRTIYRININSAKSPLLDALDCPDPSVKAPKRAVTTTPLQALGLMNNAFVLRQAKGLAARASREAGLEIGDRVDRAYRLALGRLPNGHERQASVELARERGLDAVCWVLFNTSEFLYVR
jgi:hypothetical protein